MKTFFIFLIALLFPICSLSQDKKEPRTWTPSNNFTPSKFKTGLKRNKALFAEKSQTKLIKSIDVKLPNQFDWRKVGSGLTAVKNQGNCGSCWAFASTAVMENVLKMKGFKNLDLSEQFLVSCDKQFYGCNGGDVAFDMFKDYGAIREKEFPYKATNLQCKQKLKYGPKILEWGFVDGQNGTNPDPMDIAKAIYLYGPVTAAVAVDDAFLSYGSGVFNTCEANDPNQINHLVTLIGFDLEKKYWIMRNSWGNWGEEGHMKIKWGCNSIGNGAAFIYAIDPLTIPASYE